MMLPDSGSDPEEVIRDALAATASPIESRSTSGGWLAASSRDGLDARRETIQLGSPRAVPSRRVYPVTFETTGGRRMRGYCYLAGEDAAGWRLAGFAGGADRADALDHAHRGHPWVSFGGGGDKGGFYAGGQVCEDADSNVARVRLRDTSGIVLDDVPDADRNVVFVMNAMPAFPLQVELLDAEGHIVAKHSAFPKSAN